MRVSAETVYFKKEATWLLSVWLDSKPNFGFHIIKKIKKAKMAIKGLSKTNGLCSGLV